MQRVNKCIESQLSLIHPHYKSFKGQLPNVWGRNQRIEQQTANALSKLLFTPIYLLYFGDKKKTVLLKKSTQQSVLSNKDLGLINCQLYFHMIQRDSKNMEPCSCGNTLLLLSSLS